jgi:hypothetical protein
MISSCSSCRAVHKSYQMIKFMKSLCFFISLIACWSIWTPLIMLSNALIDDRWALIWYFTSRSIIFHFSLPSAHSSRCFSICHHACIIVHCVVHCSVSCYPEIDGSVIFWWCRYKGGIEMLLERSKKIANGIRDCTMDLDCKLWPMLPSNAMWWRVMVPASA